MIKYQYQVIRFMPDQFTGEFANVGIVLFAPAQNFLACKTVNRYARLTEFFGEINGQFLLSSLRQFESLVKKHARALREQGANDMQSVSNIQKQFSSELKTITSAILTKDDSALQLTDVICGMDIDPEITIADLYERIIEKYNAEGQAQRHTDQQAWSKVYKNHFDKYGISKKLKKHVVATSKDAIEFDKSWKNGVWNCFQPLAFDLKSEDAIKSKVYKWSGIIRELETADEEVHVYFLTTSPKEHSDLNAFIKETLICKDSNLTVDIIEERQAEAFAKKVREDMEESNVMGDV